MGAYSVIQVANLVDIFMPYIVLCPFKLTMMPVFYGKILWKRINMMEIQFIKIQNMIVSYQQYQMIGISTFTRRFCTSYYKTVDLKFKNTFYYDNLVRTYIEKRTKPQFDLKKMAFGQDPTQHMVSIISNKDVWDIPQIKPFQNLLLHPFNSTMHYGVQCYQGLKAYKNQKGQIRLFRPQCNMMRFRHSSTKISLPDFDGQELLKILEEYVRTESQWIPPFSGYSLYVRPFHIAMQDSLGVKSPSRSQILIVSSPVGPYYPTGFKPISLYVDLSKIRSAPGGTGMYKVGGNYGPTIQVQRQAASKGFGQVLYLYDGKIGEVGTSNVFFVVKNEKTGAKEVITPSIEDLVLPGITRDSIIEYLKHKNIKVEQREIMMDEIIQKQKKGQLLECFCSGTAVIVSPIDKIHYKGNDYPVHIDEKKQAGDLTYQIFNQMLDIQEGRAKDPFGWTKIISN